MFALLREAVKLQQNAAPPHVLSPVEVVQHDGGDGTCGVCHKHRATVATHLGQAMTQTTAYRAGVGRSL